jgi:Domain of unknown function (DUF4037)
VEQHHRDAIARWAEAAADDDDVLAVVVAGSLTKGYGLADSDVDGFMIVTDEAFARRGATGELTFFSTEFCDYKDGYVDAKYIDRAFLEAVVERGSEPARAAFLGAIVAWSTDQSIDALVHAAATYPETGVEQRMSRFLAQVQAAQWYVGEAAKRDDAYLAGWSASRLALFACRLVLAHNRVLYPYHKWLLRTVADVPDCPDDFVELVRVLTRERTPAAAEAVVMSLLLFREWPQAPAGWSTQFMLDSEWNWLDAEPPIDDL